MNLDRSARPLAVFTAALFCVWFMVSLTWPMGRDHGILAWVGWGMLHGQVPFRDMWDVKGPGAYLPYALAQLLFGHNMWGLRVLDGTILLSGMAAVAFATGAAANGGASPPAAALNPALAAALTMLCYTTRGWWDTAQVDGWMGMLLAVAVAFILRRPSVGTAALCAALVGLCAATKPNYALMLIVLLPLLWSDRTNRFRLASGVTAGFLAPVAAVVVWFAVSGGLRELYNVLLVFNRYHARLGAFSAGDQFRRVIFMFTDPPVSLLLVPAIAGAYWLWDANRFAFWTVLAWLAGVLACIVMQGKLYVYQVVPLFPPLALLAALGVGTLVRWARPLATWTLVLLMSYSAIEFVPNWLRWITGRWTAQQYAGSFTFAGNADDFSAGTMQSVAAYLRAHSSPSDTVEYWGWDPIVNYLSERKPPTRFGYDYPLQIESPLEEPYRAEFMRGMRERPPLYMAIPQNDMNTSGLMRVSSADSFRQFAALHDFVLQNYRLERQIGTVQLWRRCAIGPPASAPSASADLPRPCPAADSARSSTS